MSNPMNSSRRQSLRRTLGHSRRRKSFLSGLQRHPRGEQLESRTLMAGDILHNFDDPYDTDNNGVFSPADILHVINQINQGTPAADGEAPGAAGTSQFYNDVNADGFVSPIDALYGINEYNLRAEGEGGLVSFRIQAVDVGTNNVLNTSNSSGPNFHAVNKGDDYELRVVVQDLRTGTPPNGTADGVYAAYLDILYPKIKTAVEIEEIQTLTFNHNPQGGTFTLTFDTDGAGPAAPQTTGNITYSNPFAPNAEFTIASAIQAALDSKFGTNRFLVNPTSLGDATKFSIRFMGQFGDRDVAMMTGNGANLTYSSTPPASPPRIVFDETIKGVYSAESFLSSFRFASQYQSGKEAKDGQTSPTADPNRIDEVGAFYTSTSGTLGSAPRELFRVRMNTVDGGSVAFTGSLAEIIHPNHDTLVLAGGSDTRSTVNASEIDIINSTPFTVSEPFSANPDTYTFAETTSSTLRNLTVMTASGGGLDTGTLTNVTISAISTTTLPVGTLAIASDNKSINFTQLSNVNNAGSPSTFTYTLRNSSTGVTDTATVTLNITAVNNAPVNTVPGSAPPLSTPEETALVINGISIADVDANESVGATMQVDLSVLHGNINLGSIPPGLTFPLGGNGTPSMQIVGSLADVNAALNALSYTPSLNYVGADTFTIVTNDRGNTGAGGAKTDTDTIALNVTAVNDAPTVTLPADTSVLAGDPVTISGTVVNDVDVGTANLTVTLSATTIAPADTHLTLAVTTNLTFTVGQENGKSTVQFTGKLVDVQNALASFTFTPAVDDGGSQSTITLTVNDGGATGSGGAKAGMDVLLVDVIPLSLPFARRDPTTSDAASVAAFTVVEGSSNISLPVLNNDLVDDPAGPPTTDKLLLSVSDPPNGTATVSGDFVQYTPDADFWGTDTFTYVMNQDVNGDAVKDGTDSTGTVTVTITNVNDAPVAANSSITIGEDPGSPTIITLSVSDVDDNNNVGFVSTLTPTITGAPANGSASVIATGPNAGKISYTPNLNFNGSDTIKFTVNDGQGGVSNTATVFITVDPVNDAPVASAGVLTAAEEVTTSGALVATDVDSASLNYTLVSTANAHGNVVITNPATGAYTYTSDLNYNGPASFTFKANDGFLDSNTATITITVTPENDAPVANPDSYLVEEDTLLNADNSSAGRMAVRANDTDVDNTLSTLTVSLEPGMGPTHALTFTLNSNGTFTYQATLDYQGPDSFVYRLTDAGGLFSTATASITVTEKNDPPVAVNDSYDVTEDVQRDVTTAEGVRDGAGLDDDPDTNNPNSTLTVVLVSPPTHSSVFVLNDDGSFSYKGAANYNGPDSFKYKLTDPFGVSSNTATVSINVLEVNDDPTANDDGSLAAPLTLIKNTAANPFIDQEINVLANDSDDPDFNVVENLTITAAGAGVSHGTVAISGDLKKVLYTPDQDYEGPDQFTYTISDGRTGTATATVYIEVVNFIPTEVTGTVFVDANNNGVQDGSEKPLAGVKVTLEGHDDIFNIDFGADTDNNPNNNVAALVVYTDIDGHYRFDAPGSLRPGMRPGDYTITEEQPAFMRDGKDQAGNNASLIFAADARNGDKIRMTLPLLGIGGGINGNNFGERGLDPSVVSINDILSSTSGDGLILAINGSTQLWSTRLTGWTNLKSCSVVLSADTSTATFTFYDTAGSPAEIRTISQVGNPRFRIMGRLGDGSELIRLDGTAADFGLNLMAASDHGPQAEGEAELRENAGYVRGVDAVMAEVGSA